MPYPTIPHAWILFCICFGLMLVAMLIMGRQGRNLYTVRRTVRRRFSVMDLEFPESYEEQRKLVQGITRLKAPTEAAHALKALRGQILTDYLLYMPATYGGIFILCYTLSCRGDIGTYGHHFFLALAIAQLVAFLLDAVENLVFLRLIAMRNIPLKDTEADRKRYGSYHRGLQLLELVKWGAATLGAVCGFSALCYYWLQGAFSDGDWIAALVLAAEVMLYGSISSQLAKKDKAAQAKQAKDAVQ